MDSFEFNKMAGAVLGTALAVFGLSELSGIIYDTHPPEKQGYAIEVEEAATGGEQGGGDATPDVPLPQLLAAADVAKGEVSHKKCLGCHDFNKGGPNKTGPNLWDIVDRPIASHEGFPYSEALKARSGEQWTYDNLFTFLNNPKAFAPGTKMVLAVKSSAERANLIAYLRTLSDNPKPLPAP
jgi:cytochrome c